MDITSTLLLFMAMVALALLPSASVALVITRSTTAGLHNGIAVGMGIVLGDLLFVCLAVLGMAALAEALGGLFVYVRYLAGAYLIWFGITLIKRKPVPSSNANNKASGNLLVSFLSGLLLTLGDIKAIIFYASFLPAFVDLTSLDVSDITVIAGITVVAVGGVKLGYAVAASRLARVLISQKSQRRTEVAAGSLMIGTGAYLLVKV
ncbi:MAG: LysE family translocator [Gammaproteobacteria bacterium]